MKRTRTQMILAFFAWVVFSAGSAWGQANFYEGKTLTVMIGAKSGQRPGAAAGVHVKRQGA